MGKKDGTRGIRTDPKLLKAVTEGVENDLFRDRAGRSLLYAAKHGIADDEIAREIETRVQRHAIQRSLGQASVLREPQLSNGQLALGTTERGRAVRISKTALAAGWLLVANAGAGKSNLLADLLPKIAQAGVRVWATDMYKRQHRQLLHLFRAAGLALVVCRARDLRCNLLEATPNAPTAHHALACDLLGRSLDLPSRARTIVRQHCYALYERFGIWRGRTDEWPTLFDLYETIRAASGENPMAKDAALDRLGALLLSLGPRAAYRKGWSHADLAQHNVVFEMAGASERVKHLTLLPTVLGRFQHQMECGAVNAPLSLMVVLDDAQRFLSESQHVGQGEMAPFVETAGIVRGAGIGLGVLVQSTEGLPAGLTENLTLKSFGRLGSARDWRRMGGEVGLDRQQLNSAMHALRPGSFIAQLGIGRWRHAFTFQTPLIDLGPPVSDDEVEASQSPLRQLPVRFAEEFRNWSPYGSQRAIDVSQPAAGQAPLGEPERRYLAAVVANPGQPSGFYTRALHLGGSRARAIREALEAAGFVRTHRIATAPRGRSSIVLEPTDKAVDAPNDGAS